MDKDQAAQKLHFVSDHFVLKANMETHAAFLDPTFEIHLRLFRFKKLTCKLYHILYQTTLAQNVTKNKRKN